MSAGDVIKLTNICLRFVRAGSYSRPFITKLCQ